MPTTPSNDTVHAVAVVSGRVQGVGFRWWTRYVAGGLGVSGSAVNRADGRVEVHVEGPRAAVEAMLARLADGPPTSRVVAVDHRWEPPSGMSGFALG
jgi:acylphosphatase